MRITLNVIGRNRETREEEIYNFSLHMNEVACLYQDKYGVAVSTKQGKIFRVTQNIEELKELM